MTEDERKLLEEKTNELLTNLSKAYDLMDKETLLKTFHHLAMSATKNGVFFKFNNLPKSTQYRLNALLAWAFIKRFTGYMLLFAAVIFGMTMAGAEPSAWTWGLSAFCSALWSAVNTGWEDVAQDINSVDA